MGTFENGFSVRTAPVCARASAVVAAVASTRASLASWRASTVALSAASKCVVRAASAANAPSRSRSNSAAVLGILAVRRDVERVIERVTGLRGDRGTLLLRPDLLVRRGE